MGIESIIGTRASLVLLNILLGLAAFGFVWGVVKLSYQRVTGSPMPRNAVTLTLDIIVESTNNILGVVNKARVSGGGAPLFLPLQPQIEVRNLATGEMLTDATPGPRTGQSGRASLGALVAAMVLSLALGVAACRPQPTPTDGSVAVTPSAWTDTARLVARTLAWALPAARMVTDAILPEPARTIVGRVIDATADYASRFVTALDAYEEHGGDRCIPRAALAALRSGLLDLARTLADHGLAIGRPIERVIDTVASLVDTLVPGCVDAGWTSTGDQTNAELRAIEINATRRGVTLRRDLDAITPAMVDGGVR